MNKHSTAFCCIAANTTNTYQTEVKNNAKFFLFLLKTHSAPHLKTEDKVEI